MLYHVVTARIENDGSVKEGKKKLIYQTQQLLKIGGLYFLRSPGKLYRVIACIAGKED